jgi:hypothetical protein
MKYRFYNTYSLKEKLIELLKPELRRRNIDERLLLNWKYIFNDSDFVDKMTPYKIIYKNIDENSLIQKILYVCTEDSKFATEFLFYKHQLLEKLNQYFGNEKSLFKDIKIKIIN